MFIEIKTIQRFQKIKNKNNTNSKESTKRFLRKQRQVRKR